MPQEKPEQIKETQSTPDKGAEHASNESMKHADADAGQKRAERATQKDTENRPPTPITRTLGRPEIVGDDGEALVKGAAVSSVMKAGINAGSRSKTEMESRPLSIMATGESNFSRTTSGVLSDTAGRPEGDATAIPNKGKELLPPVKNDDGSVIERHYSATDVSSAADGSIDQASTAIKDLKHQDGTPATDREKTQFAIDIMGAKIRTLGYLGGEHDQRGLPERIVENLPVLGSQNRQAFWLKVERGSSIEGNSLQKAYFGALNGMFGPGSDIKDLAKYTWDHHGAMCGENAAVLKTLLDGAAINSRIIHTYSSAEGNVTASGNYAAGHDFVLVNMPSDATQFDPAKHKNVFAADAHGAFLNKGTITSKITDKIGKDKDGTPWHHRID